MLRNDYLEFLRKERENAQERGTRCSLSAGQKLVIDSYLRSLEWNSTEFEVEVLPSGVSETSEFISTLVKADILSFVITSTSSGWLQFLVRARKRDWRVLDVVDVVREHPTAGNYTVPGIKLYLV